MTWDYENCYGYFRISEEILPFFLYFPSFLVNNIRGSFLSFMIKNDNFRSMLLNILWKLMFIYILIMWKCFLFYNILGGILMLFIANIVKKNYVVFQIEKVIWNISVEINISHFTVNLLCINVQFLLDRSELIILCYYKHYCK